MGRFVGYKSSHGAWNNSEWRLPTRLFFRPKMGGFGSGYNKGEPVMVTGCVIQDDLSLYM